MGVSLDEIKKLKELTGIGLTNAKAALVEANGDFDAALKVLREKGLSKVEKRGEREAREGLVDAYVHGGRIAAIVEVDCETDFVARTDEFKTLVHEIAMQVASMNPKWARPEDVPEAETARKREEFVAAFEQDAKNSKKPAEIREKIIDGQLKKYFAELVLTE